MKSFLDLILRTVDDDDIILPLFILLIGGLDLDQFDNYVTTFISILPSKESSFFIESHKEIIDTIIGVIEYHDFILANITKINPDITFDSWIQKYNQRNLSQLFQFSIGLFLNTNIIDFEDLCPYPFLYFQAIKEPLEFFNNIEMMFNRKEPNPRVQFDFIFEKLEIFLNAKFIPECDLEPFRLIVEDMKHSIELWDFDSLHNQIDEILNIIKYHDPEC